MKDDIKILEVLDYLPKHIREMINKLPVSLLSRIEEIRLRMGKPLCISGCDMELFVDAVGTGLTTTEKVYLVSAEDLRCSLQLVCNFSIYSVEEELRNGFVTVKGGHRVGVCGRTVIENGKVKVELGLARGKKLYDKRAALKEKQSDREMERALRHRKD